MIYFVTALSAEAKPIIDKYDLKRIYTLPYTLFEGESAKLIVTGIGLENAMMAVSAFLGHCPPKQGDLLVNVGICASPKEFAIGEVLLANKLTNKEHSYYPDVLFEHPLLETQLQSADAPADVHQDLATDMESYGVYKAASRFFDTHEMLFIKVVSDHFEPQSVTKEQAVLLIENALAKIEETLNNALQANKKNELFSAEEEALIKEIGEHLTKAQSDAFYDACCYFKLHYKEPLHVKAPIEKLSKQQRSGFFKDLIAALTHENVK